MGMYHRVREVILRKLDIPDYYADLRNRVNNYEIRFRRQPRKTALRLIWWNFKALFHRQLVKKEKCEINEQTGTNEKRKDLVANLCLENEKLNIAIIASGGYGDLLITANYLHHLTKNFENLQRARIDIYYRKGRLTQIRSIFHEGDLISHFYNIEEMVFCAYQYDLAIEMVRYPKIVKKKPEKIIRYEPWLIDYIQACEKFQMFNKRFFEDGANWDGQSALLLGILHKKRIQQPDIYNMLNIGEDFTYPLFIDIDEEAFLNRCGLKKNGFIVLHRGHDLINKNSDSVKLWPLSYYAILADIIKTAYPELPLVQIGVSEERCPSMGKSIDLSMVGKTTMEEVKVLLKNCLALIDGEGGMVHIRHALHGGPSVVLFGPTPMEFYGYSGNINIRGDGCAHWCEWMSSNWQERCMIGFKDHPCMHSITPDMVLEGVKKAIAVGRGNYERQNNSYFI